MEEIVDNVKDVSFENVDIYNDLPVINFEDSVKKLEEDKEHLEQSLADHEKKLNEVLERNKELEVENEVLGENISSLYKTATIELQRKDHLILELRRKYDNLIFRRNECRRPKFVNKAAYSRSQQHCDDSSSNQLIIQQQQQQNENSNKNITDDKDSGHDNVNRFGRGFGSLERRLGALSDGIDKLKTRYRHSDTEENKYERKQSLSLKKINSTSSDNGSGNNEFELQRKVRASERRQRSLSPGGRDKSKTRGCEQSDMEENKHVRKRSLSLKRINSTSPDIRSGNDEFELRRKVRASERRQRSLSPGGRDKSKTRGRERSDMEEDKHVRKQSLAVKRRNRTSHDNELGRRATEGRHRSLSPEEREKSKRGHEWIDMKENKRRRNQSLSIKRRNGTSPDNGLGNDELELRSKVWASEGRQRSLSPERRDKFKTRSGEWTDKHKKKQSFSVKRIKSRSSGNGIGRLFQVSEERGRSHSLEGRGRPKTRDCEWSNKYDHEREYYKTPDDEISQSSRDPSWQYGESTYSENYSQCFPNRGYRCTNSETERKNRMYQHYYDERNVRHNRRDHPRVRSKQYYTNRSRDSERECFGRNPSKSQVQAPIYSLSRREQGMPERTNRPYLGTHCETSITADKESPRTPENSHENEPKSMYKDKSEMNSHHQRSSYRDLHLSQPHTNNDIEDGELTKSMEMQGDMEDSISQANKKEKQSLASNADYTLEEQAVAQDKSKGDTFPQTKCHNIASLRSSPTDPATIKDGNISVSFSNEQCEFAVSRKRRSWKLEGDSASLKSTTDKASTMVSDTQLVSAEKGVKRSAGSASESSQSAVKPDHSPKKKACNELSTKEVPHPMKTVTGHQKKKKKKKIIDECEGEIQVNSKDQNKNTPIEVEEKEENENNFTKVQNKNIQEMPQIVVFDTQNPMNNIKTSKNDAQKIKKSCTKRKENEEASSSQILNSNSCNSSVIPDQSACSEVQPQASNSTQPTVLLRSVIIGRRRKCLLSCNETLTLATKKV